MSELETAEVRAAAAGGDEKRAYVQRIFSEIAPRYDLLNHLLSFNIDKRWRRRAIATLNWQRAPQGSYVDLCAGTLDVSTQLARSAGFAGRVVSADFAEPMLRAGVRKSPPESVAPVAADALQLPLPTSGMSGAIVAFGIRNVADLDRGLREVHRVLEPGARFVILEFTTPRSSLVRSFYHLYFHHVLPFIGGMISGHRTAYQYLPRSVANFPIEEELAGRMRAAGFADVSWRTLTFGIAAIHVGTKA
ncbi:MAG TPA: bifunctional demethylmenaquinone methyltransferase/2-methoxy-6-polyprenyl-1,4-benzoquinol methylase UbiE [Gemmatimonadaceae bacterium]|nr:bifunctional demethylmenaquinone methyltransferase/2-methoxy-6-polyprenyl-1,4-benzoquinol methylase UbiE [Gemmatimonadaceae bacterium]